MIGQHLTDLDRNDVTIVYDVIGIAHSGTEYKLRRFQDPALAAEYALSRDMKNWDDVVVRPAEARGGQPIKYEPLHHPLNVLWQHGHAYIVDGAGTKIASLLGPQWKRELLAEFVIEASRRMVAL